MTNTCRLGFILILLVSCRESPDVSPSAPGSRALPPAIGGEEASAKKDTLQADETLKVRITAVDRTNPKERPENLNLEKDLNSLAKKAAEKAGLQLSEKGDFAAVEIHYLLSKDGVSTPKADRALLTWGVMVTLRIEDEMGLAEELSALRKDEAPFVRSAVPDMNKAVGRALSRAAESAFLDVHMQWRYRNAPKERALDGLKSQKVEELWAAMRRLGEMGHQPAVPAIIQVMRSHGALTTHVAAGVLARLKDPRAIPAFVKAIMRAKEAQAVYLLETLGGAGIPGVEKALQRLAKEHPMESIRAKANELFAPTAD